MNQELQNLGEKIAAKDFLLGVIGLGYVGLPLSLTFLRQGIPVLLKRACSPGRRISRAWMNPMSSCSASRPR